MSEDSKDSTFIIPLGDNNPMETIYNRFMAYYTPFGFTPRDEQVKFHPFPYLPDPGDELMLRNPWRILLELYAEDQRMSVGLDLFGDIILGRGESHPGRIIFDLEPYGAKSLGVSREHAMLRPTVTKLFVIDQGSTNGTTVNGAPSGRGIATPLKHEDLINLGNMVLMVHVVKKPGD